jgi:hypothetical protein
MQEHVLILGLAERKQQAVLLGVPLIITPHASTWKCHIKSAITTMLMEFAGKLLAHALVN